MNATELWPRSWLMILGCTPCSYYHRLKERGWPTLLQVGALAKRVVGNRQLIRTYYYNALPPGGPEHDERLEAIRAMLKGAPDIIFQESRLQPIMEYGETGPYKSYVEKGADTAITADMVACATKNEYDVPEPALTLLRNRSCFGYREVSWRLMHMGEQCERDLRIELGSSSISDDAEGFLC